MMEWMEDVVGEDDVWAMGRIIDAYIMIKYNINKRLKGEMHHIWCF